MHAKTLYTPEGEWCIEDMKENKRQLGQRDVSVGHPTVSNSVAFTSAHYKYSLVRQAELCDLLKCKQQLCAPPV